MHVFISITNTAFLAWVTDFIVSFKYTMLNRPYHIQTHMVVQCIPSFSPLARVCVFLVDSLTDRLLRHSEQFWFPGKKLRSLLGYTLLGGRINRELRRVHSKFRFQNRWTKSSSSIMVSAAAHDFRFITWSGMNFSFKFMSFLCYRFCSSL